MTVTLSVPSVGAEPALRLRPWEMDDLPALLSAHEDPALRRWLATSLTGPAQARQWLDAQAEGWATATRFSFAVTSSDLVLGHVVVKAAAAEVGYWTAAAARGRGVATRALEAVSHWAFQTLELPRLGLVHAAGNHASCRVAVKCGFALHEVLPAAPPAFPSEGHRHVRSR
ncbi:GNAT family N-acetyltransferase [Lentzea sp.]|uniref:GNAT family N-acetyltransferase n=1 Tax=Lentzea sp. TaxID=56099 RepID=UPI002ED39F1B